MTEDDSRRLMNSFSQVFCEPLMASPVTNSRYTNQHAKMVVHQGATLKRIISCGLEVSASPMEPLEATPRDSSHAPSRTYGRHTTEVSPQHADLRTLSTQETEKQLVSPASSLPEAAIGNTSGGENIPLGTLTDASNFFENKPEVSAPSQKQENLHESQSFSLSLSQKPGLCNGAASNDSGVGVLVDNSSSVPVGEYRVKEEFAPILQAVLLRHGDIATDYSL